jgi:hypothetical protein
MGAKLHILDLKLIFIQILHGRYMQIDTYASGRYFDFVLLNEIL